MDLNLRFAFLFLWKILHDFVAKTRIFFRPVFIIVLVPPFTILLFPFRNMAEQFELLIKPHLTGYLEVNQKKNKKKTNNHCLIYKEINKSWRRS